jgi:hypothetical protein
LSIAAKSHRCRRCDTLRSLNVTGRRWLIVRLRLAYLGVPNALAMLRLLPISDRAKDAEILTLRHQITVLERQLHGEKVRFTPADRAFLAAPLHRLPRDLLRQIRLLVRPETVLRWHRNLLAHPSRSDLAPQTCRAATHGRLDPDADATSRPREQLVGLPENPR